MFNKNVTDIETVGIIVPLPNHYNSDMPQGHGAVRTQYSGSSFFTLEVVQLDPTLVLRIHIC